MAPKMSRPASSAAGYAEQDESQELPINMLSITDPVESGSSANESDASSDSEDGEDDEAEDKKSNDAQQDDGGDKSPPPDASGASSSQPLPTTVMVLPAPETQTDFTDEELITMMGSATNIAMKQELIEKNIMPKARFYVECLNKTKKEIKKMKDLEAKERRKEERRVKKEQEKLDKQEVRTRDFTVNVKGEDGVSKPVVVNASMTIKDFREAIVRSHYPSMSKKLSKTMRLVFGSADLTLNPRRTLGKHGLVDGSSVQIFFAGQGGAKRTRSNMVEEVGVILTPTPLQNDPVSVTNALKVTDIKFEGWLESLSMEKIEALVGAMENQSRTGNIQSMVNPYLRFVKEYEDITVSCLIQHFLNGNATVPSGGF